MTTKTRRPRNTRVARRRGAPRANPVIETARDQPPRRVLVASDGSKAAAAAIRFARQMEAEGLWAPEAMTSVEHIPIAIADVALPMPVAAPEPSIIEGPIDHVRRQVRRLGGKEWGFRSEVGTAAMSILDVATAHHAELIVLGLGKHGKLARLFGAETAARVCRHSQVPVLAVDHHAKGRPETIVAAMDFGASSVRAAREAAALLADGGRLHLLHVRFAVNGHAIRDQAWEHTYALGVERGFERLAAELRRTGIVVTTELRRGNVLESVLEVAKDLHAGVIAVGSHNQNIVDRMLLGSTPSLLLRSAHCSVLVAPPTDET